MMSGSMVLIKRFGLRAIFLLLGICATVNLLAAQTLDALAQSGKLVIQTRVVPQDNIIALQQVELQIEVATDRWFSGGTTIGRFEINDAIVLQREKFAVNATRVVAGVTWTVQTWVLTIYPQRSGRFEVPPIPLALSIAGEGLEKIQGQLSTGLVEFSANVPDELQDKSSWVASPVFGVKENFNRKLEHFKPGDALIRTIKFSAEDTPAMMLPTLTPEKIDGMSIYHKPPELSDKVNRGDYLAQRTEIVTYVFGAPGEYVLAEEVFYWWNLEKQQLEEITLPAHHFTVGAIAAEMGMSAPGNKEDKLPEVERFDNRLMIALLLGMLVIAFYLIKLIRKRRPGDEIKKVLSEHELQKAFSRACRRRETRKAIALLYQYLDHFAPEQFKGEIRPLLSDDRTKKEKAAFDTVMASIYSRNTRDEPGLHDFAEQFVRRLKQKGRADRRWPTPVDLRLN